MATPIILDCDPGHDDAIALLLALASPELELVGVTTVSGNQTLEKTTANALRVLEFVGRAGVPVHAGADRPLVRERFVAAYVHGETGLDGPDLPPPETDVKPQHAVAFIADQVRAHVAQPGLVEVRDAYIEVDCGWEQGRGRTNVDWRGRETSPPPNSKVGVDVDGDAFARLLIDRVTSLG